MVALPNLHKYYTPDGPAVTSLSPKFVVSLCSQGFSKVVTILSGSESRVENFRRFI